MRRIVLIVPGLARASEHQSVLRQDLPALRTLAESGEVTKLAALPRVQTPEALYLGMSPTEAQMPQGPLTVSAFGADPPDRSLQFHLSLLSLHDGSVGATGEIAEEEARKVVELAAKLNTPKLTIVPGEKGDHGLVFEAFGDLHTTSETDAIGKPYTDVLPEGDFEKPLRRFIDDSVNLLGELELNVRRIDEGRPPLNLLWPWGQGARTRVPNLHLRRGERAVVESASIRLAGLTRLTGYWHEDRSLVGTGVNTRFGRLAARALSRDVTIALLDAPEDEEQLDWFVRELDRELLRPIVDSARLSPTRIVILAPAQPLGLGLSAELPSVRTNAIPFDERALDERLVSTRDLADEVERGVLE